MRVRLATAIILAYTMTKAGPVAHGQGYPGYVTPASATQPARRYEQTTGTNNPALNFFGGGRRYTYMQPAPVQAPAPVAVQTTPTGKPFSGYYQQPTISPYLALDARESDAAIPNYFMYVKPQLDQQRINQSQQVQNRRLQQQLRRASAGGAVVTNNGGIPTTGHSAQFLNSGGYYPGQR